MNSTKQYWTSAIFVAGSLVAVILLARNLSGGIILGEPDEFVHAQISQSLLKNPIPFYSGAPFFYDLPGFFVASSLVLRIVKDPLFSVRLVSLLSTVALGLAIFAYLRRRGLTGTLAFCGALIFYLTPLTIFYSQVGLIEPLLSLFLFCFVALFDAYASGSRRRYAVLAGLFLTLALLTKYTALYSILILASIFLYRSAKGSLNEFRKGRKNYLALDVGSFFPLFMALGSVFLTAYYFYKKFPWEFKLQTYQALGLTQMAIFRPFTNFNPETVGNILWWFPWPLLLAGALGLLVFSARLKGRAVFFLANFIILFILVFSRAPFHPRYLVVLLPFLAVFSAFCLDFAGRFIVFIPRFRGIFPLAAVLIYAIFYRSIISDSYFSTKHSLLEESANYVTGNPGNKNKWVLSNYWPNIVSSKMPGNPYGWLTLDTREIQIFNPQETRSGLELIRAGQAVVLVEERYSGMLVYSPSRYEALVRLKRTRPEATIYDKSPNFPFFRNSLNSVNIYMPSNL